MPRPSIHSGLTRQAARSARSFYARQWPVSEPATTDSSVTIGHGESAKAPAIPLVANTEAKAEREHVHGPIPSFMLVGSGIRFDIVGGQGRQARRDVDLARAADDAFAAVEQFTRDQRVIDFCHKHRLVLDWRTQWRWVEDGECAGQINGLGDHFKGVAKITNGILCWLERADGVAVEGHFDWFVKAKKVNGGKRLPSAFTRYLLE